MPGHMSGNKWVLSFIERLNSTIRNLILSYFTYITTDISTFRVHVPSLITVEFLLFITSQFTTNAQNILHLN
jgi:hypothetical protein